MAKTKKRLSKKAKAALKVLKESKLLDNSKTNTAEKTDPTFTPNASSFTNKKAHKARPNKKRG